MWQKYGNLPGVLGTQSELGYVVIQQTRTVTMSYEIALVEDERALRENYSEVLQRQGYRVNAYGSRAEAEAAFASSLPDLAIIDIGLAEEVDGGFALCQYLRSQSDTLPIIFLSARDSDLDIVSGLRMGADDYLTKDISLPHLVARISALFRRQSALQKGQDDHSETLSRGELTIDVPRLRCSWREQPVDLTLTEFWMVYSLTRYPGQVKNRQQLMQDSQMVVDDSTITSHIKRIRRKFAAVDSDFDQIDTVYGMGYRWNES